VGDFLGTMAKSTNVCADMKSAQATEMQARVLERMHTEIEQQVRDIDEALRVLEDAFLHDFGTLPQDELAVKWARTREQRDEGLAVLDKLSMTACHAMDTAREDSELLYSSIPERVHTLAKLETRQRNMQEMEAQMATAKPGKDWTQLAEHLHKLRQQRVQRPRILCSQAVSSRTGQGLSTLRRALVGLMEDTRLFAHVGAKVPLNYSILERLAHQGREELHQLSTPLTYRGGVTNAKMDANSRTISFKSFCTIRSRQQCPVGSKAYYELEILTERRKWAEYLLFGFASAAFSSQLGPPNEGVGADAVSWAVNGSCQAKWHKGKGEIYKCKWKRDDVIGLACDLQAMQMLVSVNGSFTPPNGCVFDLAPDAVLSGLFAAFSCDGGTIGFNLGEAPFKYDPPAADYCAFVEFASNPVHESVFFSTCTCLLSCCMRGLTLYLVSRCI